MAPAKGPPLPKTVDMASSTPGGALSPPKDGDPLELSLEDDGVADGVLDGVTERVALGVERSDGTASAGEDSEPGVSMKE